MPNKSMNPYNSNVLRSLFSNALSLMYQDEVPLYADLLNLVNEVNESHKEPASPANINLERHGAIRLGKTSELYNIRRLFHLMGMFPVAYYDLSSAGLPVHSTAFRPIKQEDLDANPFRIFTSLLRLDLIDDESLSKNVSSTLDKRDIFNNELLELIDFGEQHHQFNTRQSLRFIELAVDIFRWHGDSLVTHQFYQQLKETHPLIADIVSFKGPHINHLTPTTLDIDAVQASMTKKKITTKDVIEGPPLRQCPILLRQTSFTAIAENVHFKNNNGSFEQGEHRARFGEIEQRGIALTEKGQSLYEQLIQSVKTKRGTPSYENALKEAFKAFPDSYERLRTEGLAYFKYVINNSNLTTSHQNAHLNIEQLINNSFVIFEPILYEDFLPVSAAGIFHSNLNEQDNMVKQLHGNQSVFEQQLGCVVYNPFALYQKQQDDSVQKCLSFFK